MAEARCHALLRRAAPPWVVRCGRPEDHELHDPTCFMSHVYSGAPPDAGDPYEYDVLPDAEETS